MRRVYESGFRVIYDAAPLKHEGVEEGIQEPDQFPRHLRRGPIEALWVLRQGVLSSGFRVIYDAAPLKRVDVVVVQHVHRIVSASSTTRPH